FLVDSAQTANEQVGPTGFKDLNVGAREHFPRCHFPFLSFGPEHRVRLHSKHQSRLAGRLKIARRFNGGETRAKSSSPRRGRLKIILFLQIMSSTSFFFLSAGGVFWFF